MYTPRDKGSCDTHRVSRHHQVCQQARIILRQAASNGQLPQGIHQVLSARGCTLLLARHDALQRV